LDYQKEVKRSSENTLSAYQADLEQFTQVIYALSGIRLEPRELTAAIIKDYADWLPQQGYQPSTIARKMAAVRSFLNYFVEIGDLHQTDLLGSLRSPEASRKKPQILNEGELLLLLQPPHGNPTPSDFRDCAILNLLYFAGLRATEIVELKVTEVYLDQGFLLHPVEPSRRVSLGSAMPSLQQYLRLGRPSLVRGTVPELFLNQRGSRLTRQGLWLVVRNWAERVGIESDISPHMLRNTRVKHLLDRGVSRKEIQSLLGLSSPNAIRAYLE
jgi:integrase/recombinase XerD